MIRWALGTILIFITNSGFAQKAVPTKVMFVVKDDIGQVVTNARVRGGFLDLTNSGARDRFDGTTDLAGVFVAVGKAVIGVGGWITASDHYDTEEKRSLSMKQTANLERWFVEIPVTLKRVKNPTAMYVRKVEKYAMGKRITGRSNNLNFNVNAQYDLVKGDMLEPYGTGAVADIEFAWNVSIVKTNDIGLAVFYDNFDEIRMTNNGDGILKGKPDGSEGCESGCRHISDYEAPINGYTNAISFYRIVRGMKAETNDDRHYLYYFRIRTKTNEIGIVTNALYGKIYGQINRNFTYYLNTTPNDRNVESNFRVP